MNKVISIIYCLSLESFSSCEAILYINPESWPVVGFCPHIKVRGCSGHTLTLFIPLLGPFKEVFITMNPQSDYRALSLSLSHRNSSMVGATPGIWKTVRGALTAPDRKKSQSIARCIGYGIMRKKSLKILQPLEQLTSSRRIMTVTFRLSLLRCSSGRTGTQS